MATIQVWYAKAKAYVLANPVKGAVVAFAAGFVLAKVL